MHAEPKPTCQRLHDLYRQREWCRSSRRRRRHPRERRGLQRSGQGHGRIKPTYKLKLNDEIRIPPYLIDFDNDRPDIKIPPSRIQAFDASIIYQNEISKFQITRQIT